MSDQLQLADFQQKLRKFAKTLTEVERRWMASLLHHGGGHVVVQLFPTSPPGGAAPANGELGSDAWNVTPPADLLIVTVEFDQAMEPATLVPGKTVLFSGGADANALDHHDERRDDIRLHNCEGFSRHLRPREH